MKKQVLTVGLFATLIFASCSSDDNTVKEIDNSMKSPIEFSLTQESGQASSVTTKAVTRSGFTTGTGIVMRMMAKDNSDANNVKYTKTNAVAATEESGYSSVSFNNTANEINQRYWDDAFGRKTKLSIFAVAVPGKTDVSALSLNGDNTWSASNTNNTISWSVTKDNAQTLDNISNEDLVYSNNIQDNTSLNLVNGVRQWDFSSSSYKDFDGSNFDNLTAGSMQFRLKDPNAPTGPGKFDIGNMHFRHALSRVTVKIKFASEFTTDEKNLTSVVLQNMPYMGTLDVANGTFSNTNTTNFTMMQSSDTPADASYDAMYMSQILPGYVIDNNNSTQFLIINTQNEIYNVSNASVYAALNASNSITMEQGKNYVLNITVNKAKITDVTATLANWDEYTGSFEINNANNTYTFKVLETTKGSACTEFDLFRAENTDESETGWELGYKDNQATLTNKGNGVWSTDWNYKSQKTKYHFRTVGPKNTQINETDGNAATFNMTAGTTDYHWGAPMKSDANLSYDNTKGFGESISPAIGPTESQINITEFHMTSQVIVKLETDNVINLTDATLKIKGSNNTATVNMGNGLITASGNTDVSLVGYENQANQYYSYVIPQELGDNVKLEITTDGNVFTVQLNKIKETTTNSEINKWECNHRYTYTIKLKATGIDNLTCTLAAWQDVTGDNQDVTIED